MDHQKISIMNILDLKVDEIEGRTLLCFNCSVFIIP